MRVLFHGCIHVLYMQDTVTHTNHFSFYYVKMFIWLDAAVVVVFCRSSSRFSPHYISPKVVLPFHSFAFESWSLLAYFCFYIHYSKSCYWWFSRSVYTTIILRVYGIFSNKNASHAPDGSFPLILRKMNYRQQNCFR